LLAATRLAPEVHVVIAGSGPLENAVRRELPASVKLVGHVDREQLAALRAGSCMSLLPSDCLEVSPYAALESAAAARPVVARSILRCTSGWRGHELGGCARRSHRSGGTLGGRLQDPGLDRGRSAVLCLPGERPRCRDCPSIVGADGRPAALGPEPSRRRAGCV